MTEVGQETTRLLTQESHGQITMRINTLVTMRIGALVRAIDCLSFLVLSVGMLAFLLSDARAQLQPVSRLQALAGDRQIVVNSATPPLAYRVRALDSNGQPIAGTPLVMGPTGLGGPWRTDEFGFRGFNAAALLSYCSFGCPPAGYTFITDASGIAEGRGQYVDALPSAFLYGATSGGTGHPQVFFSVVAVTQTPPGKPTMIVEYFHQGLGHYFITHFSNEITALDENKLVGWTRSVGAFIVYDSEADAPAGAVPVCRFFSSRYTSHFYTADVSECAAVETRWPEDWRLETREAFWINVPSAATGSCPSQLQPVYRLYLSRNGPTHRYVTDAVVRDRMVASGWISEGYGPNGAVFCTPR